MRLRLRIRILSVDVLRTGMYNLFFLVVGHGELITATQGEVCYATELRPLLN